RLRAADPGLAVTYRDLNSAPLPHLSAPPGASKDGARDSMDRALVDEFLDADIVVIGAPMYNFTIPTQLKAWIDRIVVAGKTFRYRESGPEGMVGDKRVIVALARGGFYDDGSPAACLEFLESYLRGIFGFIGIE